MIAQPRIIESRLANGIRLVAAQTGDVPLATISVVLPGGTATDPVGKAGLTGFATALADKGTPLRTAEQIAARLESLGATMQRLAVARRRRVQRDGARRHARPGWRGAGGCNP